MACSISSNKTNCGQDRWKSWTKLWKCSNSNPKITGKYSVWCGLYPSFFLEVPGRGVPAGPVSLAATAGLKGHPWGQECSSLKRIYCLSLTWFSRISIRNTTNDWTWSSSWHRKSCSERQAWSHSCASSVAAQGNYVARIFVSSQHSKNLPGFGGFTPPG